VIWVKDGKRVKPGTPGAEKVSKESAKWYGKVKDAETGRWRNVPLSRDKGVAKRILAKLLAAEDAERAGLVNPLDAFKGDAVRDYLPPFLAYMAEQGDGPRHVKDTARLVNAVLDGCNIVTVADLAKCYEAVSDYLTALDCGPRTKNTYRQAVVSFCRYLTREKKRLASNPLIGLPTRPTPKAERRRIRRALTPDQLQHFVLSMTTRPLNNALEAARRRKKRRAKDQADLAPAYRDRLMLKGRERALLYATAAATGLREGELKSLLVRDLHPTVDVVCLSGDRTKNGEDAALPLAPELAAALRAWIADTKKGAVDPVFAVPGYSSIMRAWKKDLAAAGIPYRDDKGRVFDFHSLRKCLGTFLRLAGIDPAVSMKMMRHSDIRLTMEVYNDDQLQELAPVVNVLPRLKL
jgi:integrase